MSWLTDRPEHPLPPSANNRLLLCYMIAEATPQARPHRKSTSTPAASSGNLPGAQTSTHCHNIKRPQLGFLVRRNQPLEHGIEISASVVRFHLRPPFLLAYSLPTWRKMVGKDVVKTSPTHYPCPIKPPYLSFTGRPARTYPSICETPISPGL